MKDYQSYQANSDSPGLTCTQTSLSVKNSRLVPTFGKLVSVLFTLSALLATMSQIVFAQNGKTIAPTKGATLSNNWSEWNLLADRPGNNYGDIAARVRTAWYNYMGLNGDIPAVDVRFVPGKPDEAFSTVGTVTVDNTGTPYWESITEGQGYAMMFAAEFGDGSGSADDIAAHKMFDALARYDNRELQNWHGEPPYYWYSDSYTYVRQSDGYVYHPAVGTFNGVPNVVRVAPAPDGEQWMAMAYFIAQGKWGSKGADGNPINLIAFQAIPGLTYPAQGNNTVTTTDYAGLGNLILQSYLHTEDWYIRDNFPGAQYALVDMFDINHNPAWNPSNSTYLPAFINDNGYSGTLRDYQITDDSYCLPAFAEYWSKYATADNAVWAKVASAERALIHANVNNSPTGLASCYSDQSGTAYARPSDGQQGLENDGDASRVPATNITLDWMWWGDPSNTTDFGWQNNWANTFIGGEWNRSTKVYGPQPSTKTDYDGLYYSGALFQDGTEVDGITSHLESTAAQNAVSIDLVNNQAEAWYFVDELMNMPQPDGVHTWGSAYWDGNLYMIALMEASTYFRPVPPTGNAKPTPPTLTAKAGNASVSLSWTAPYGATSYQVKYGTASGTYTKTLASQSGTTTKVSSLTNGTEYYFVVTASNSKGTSGYSNQAKAKPTAVVSKPTAPILTATEGNKSVALSWTAPAGATSYQVKYGTVMGVHKTTLASQSTTTLTVSSLKNGTKYYFVVTASNSGGTSGYSNEASATPTAPTVPPAPTLTATKGNAAVSLSWTASTGATSYQVKYGTSSGVYTTTLASQSTTTANVLSLVNGTTYYFVVTASNSAGTSGYSNVAAATPTAGTVPPAITITASSISPSTTDTAGSAITYSVTFKNTGGDLTNGILGIRVNNSGGTQVDAYTLGSVNLASGASKTITYASTTPSPTGVYSVYGAAWNSDFSTTYNFSSLPSLTSD